MVFTGGKMKYERNTSSKVENVKVENYTQHSFLPKAPLIATFRYRALKLSTSLAFCAMVLLSSCTDLSHGDPETIIAGWDAAAGGGTSNIVVSGSSSSAGGGTSVASASRTCTYAAVTPGTTPVTGRLTCPTTGEVYKTVTIGSAIWMAENLNYGTRVNGTAPTANQSNNSVIEKYCYGDDVTKCTTHGGLYQWSEAMGFSSTCNSTPCASSISTGNHQGICPTGWHIPKTAEWNALATDLGGSSIAGDKMKTNSGWSINTGTNSSGFSGLPAGYRNNGGGFNDRGVYAFFWEASEDVASYALYRYLYGSYANLIAGSNLKASGFSVRCLRD
jgi:uncharacterized protein (TIGR02145 family)